MAPASILTAHQRQRDRLANGIDTVWNRASGTQQTELLALIRSVQDGTMSVTVALKRVAAIDRHSQTRAA